MKKREVSIINFLNLSKEEYEKILEYRNQKFIRKSSKNQNIITKEEHENYHKLLEKKDKFFAFLIRVDDVDYGVISLKKIDEKTYYIGEYLVDELYKFEGGGVMLRFCMLYLFNIMGVKYTSYDIKTTNTRGIRSGIISKWLYGCQKDDFYQGVLEILDFNDPQILNSKARKMFDKIYTISNCQI